MKIFTLTLNPAFDLHAGADSFLLHCESVADVLSRDAGGKGVNISRALTAVGMENEAIVWLGRENGSEFSTMLDKESIPHTDLFTEGRIRENITLHVAGERETRLSFRGFAASDAMLDETEKYLLDRVTPGDIVTFTGSVPSGVTHERVITFLSRVREKGALLVLDSKSLTREDLLALNPALIKPNEEEVGAYLGRAVESLDACVDGARALSLSGIGCVMVSFGGDGALLATGGKVYRACPPKIDPVSTVGAGDSSIAGFLYAAGHGMEAKECLCYAVAFGTAACLTEGTRAPRREDIESVLAKVEMQNIF